MRRFLNSGLPLESGIGLWWPPWVDSSHSTRMGVFFFFFFLGHAPLSLTSTSLNLILSWQNIFFVSTEWQCDRPDGLLWVFARSRFSSHFPVCCWYDALLFCLKAFDPLSDEKLFLYQVIVSGHWWVPGTNRHKEEYIETSAHLTKYMLVIALGSLERTLRATYNFHHCIYSLHGNSFLSWLHNRFPLTPHCSQAFQIGAALSKNTASILIFRFLGGVSRKRAVKSDKWGSSPNWPWLWRVFRFLQHVRFPTQVLWWPICKILLILIHDLWMGEPYGLRMTETDTLGVQQMGAKTAWRGEWVIILRGLLFEPNVVRLSLTWGILLFTLVGIFS